MTGVNQYPTANAAGITLAAGLLTGAAVGVGVDYVVANGGANAGDTLTIAVASPTAGSCQFTYQAPVAANTAPVVTSTAATLACN